MLLATHLLCDIARRWLAYACRQPIGLRSNLDTRARSRFQPKTEWSVSGRRGFGIRRPLHQQRRSEPHQRKRAASSSARSAQTLAAASSRRSAGACALI